MLETLRCFPSCEVSESEEIRTSLITYPTVSILFIIICETSTACVILLPRALIVIVGRVES